MNREIKFRIWSNSYNKYIESYAKTFYETFGEGRYGYEGYHLALRPDGKLYDADVGIDYPGTQSEIPTLDWEDESENNEVEMSTGLKDKNGKEIYEGDIVDAKVLDANKHKTIIGTIVFGSGSFFIRSTNSEMPIYTAGGSENIKVIGNIHENLELLEKGETNE